MQGMILPVKSALTRIKTALTKTGAWAKETSKTIHHHIARRPHNHLISHWQWYASWHSRPYHHHVHLSTAGVYILVVGFFIFSNIPLVRASANWVQSDWSGGAGTSTSNQYESASDVVTSTANQVSLDTAYKTGTFKGNELSSGSTNFNVTTPTALRYNTSQTYNDSVFSYGGGSPTQITVDTDGDYFLSLTVPVNSSNSVNDSNVRDQLEADIRVNGAKVDVGVGRSSYIREYDHFRSSVHIAVLLEDLTATDYIEAFVHRPTINATYAFSGDFTLYTELVAESQTVFNATGTRSVASTNLNGSLSQIQWTEGREDTGYTHDDSSNSQNLQIDEAGKYFISVNIPLSGAVTRGSVGGIVQLNGSTVEGGLFRQGYIRNDDGNTTSSIHWTGIVETTNPNDTLTVAVQQLASAGTITTGGEKATLFAQKLPETSVYYGKAVETTAGANWNPTSKTTVAWATDDIVDDNVYTHDTSTNNHQVTVEQDGDYLLSFNLAHTSTLQRSNPIVTVQVDGSDITGAVSQTGYNRGASGHDEASNQLLVPLVGLSAGQVVTVSVQAEDITGTVDDDTPATLMLWQKGYATSGTLTSAVYDAGFPADWEALTVSNTGAGSISVKARTDSSSDMSSADDFTSCESLVSGNDLEAGSSCVDDQTQYIQYQVTLTSDGNTPILDGIDLAYTASDQVAPVTNASNLAMFASNGGASVTSDAWTNAEEPYFIWDAGEDDPSGNGLRGYCLYLGQDDTADPILSKGVLGTSPVSTDGACQFITGTNSVDLSTSGYIGSAMTSSNNPYYLNVKAVDIAGNVFEGASAQFQFRFDNTDPNNPAFVSAPSQFISDKEVTLTWDTAGGSAPSDSNSGLAGMQYRIGSGGTWYGDNHNGNQDASDLLTNDGSYTTVDPIDFDELEEGNNIIYFRTWDNAGNASTAHVTTVVKLNTASPTTPQNITATPETNTSNSFSFSWLPPASFTGSSSNLTYCYTVNTLPTAINCTFTDPGETSLTEDAYATQPGENTLYVVAKDEAGNINYATYGSTTFTANTPAPGIPQNVEIADISVKSTENWKLAMSWEEPENTGAGIATYNIYRSTNGADYTLAATTSATSYVDQNLEQKKYYYQVKACDSANNCGAVTNDVNMTPTGRYTEPATLIVQPGVSGVSTRKAAVSWVTERTSDSKIALGTESGKYSSEEISNSDQVKNHEINLTGLEPGTTYFYVAKWTDEDGNTGVSAEKSFKTLPAPTIKNVEVRRTTLTTAIIDFTSVNGVKTNVYFGLSENFGGFKEVNTSAEESTYTIELTGLIDGETYFYKLNPVDSDGNEYDGTVLSFETPPRPEISNITVEQVEDSASGAHKVSWRTNVATSSLVRYRSEEIAPQEISDSELVVDHEVIIKTLEDDTEYTLVIESRDKGGNLALSDEQVFQTPLDTRPPNVSEMIVETSLRGSGAGARGQIVVSWTTDEPSTSQVAFGQGSSGSFTGKTAEDSQLVTEHVVIVSDLPTSSVYHVQPVSRDSAGNEGTGEDQSAIIGRANESVLTIIINTLQRIFGL